LGGIVREMGTRRDDLLKSALAYCVEKHSKTASDGRDPMPFATHPIEVSLILCRLGGITDENVLAAALLHDTVEHAGVKPANLRKKFGRNIADLVAELTRQEPSVEGLSKPAARELRLSQMLEEIAAMSLEAKTIKLADRIANMRAASLRQKDLTRYKAESRRVLDAIGDVNSPMWAEANRIHAALS
jgi:(p)ppGpp synthase/HD superfamily hydrolase